MRVAVMDGHPAMQAGLKTILNAAGIETIGSWSDGDKALEPLRKLRPDLIILGLNLTGPSDGITLCRMLKSWPEAPKVLVHTAYNFAEDIVSCLLAGADSYLHKRADVKTLLDVVRRTATGEKIWEVGEHVGEARSQVKVALDGTPLTSREREVLALKLRRYSNIEIARALNISLNTTKHHVTRMNKKLEKDWKKFL